METVPDRNSELMVSVSDPLRHVDPIKDYVTYNLATRTTFSTYPSTDLAVRRRYKDFLEFRQQLVTLFPSIVVPPLPEKMSTKYLDRFSDSFLEKRRRALEQFMTRLTVHPILSQSDHLRNFLSEENWVKLEEERPAQTGGWKMSLGMRSGKSKNDPDGNSFENLKNYFIEFHKTLSSIHSLLKAVSLKHYDLANQYTSLGEAFLSLADQPESSLEEAIRNIAQVFAQKQSLLLSEAATSLDYNTVESIKEYVLIGQTALTVLKYRDAPLNAYLSVLNEVQDAKSELSKLQKQQEEPTQKKSSFSSMLGLSEDPQAKINKLQEKIQTDEEKLSHNRESLEQVSRGLISEMERLHQYKLKDLKGTLIEFIQGQIDLNKKSADNLEQTLTTISNISLMEVQKSGGFLGGDNQNNTSGFSEYGFESYTTSSSSKNANETFTNYNVSSLGSLYNNNAATSTSSVTSSSNDQPFTSPFSDPSVSSSNYSNPFTDEPPPIPQSSEPVSEPVSEPASEPESEPAPEIAPVDPSDS